ncbi:MAG: TolC family protein [Pseudomonadota bacterium]
MTQKRQIGKGRAFSQRTVMATALSSVLLLGGCAVTPEPLSEAEHGERVQQDLSRLFADQEPLSGPVTLHEAMARAIKYNLDNRLKLMEETLAEQQLDLSAYDMLPQVVAGAGYQHRNNYSGATSESLVTGQESLEPSTSQERSRRLADLSFSWDVLDFGVSYIRAQQEADRALIARERQRKVVHNIIQDVRSAYWRAVSAQRLLKRVDPLLARVQQAQDNARQIEQRQLQEPMQALNYQRTLLDTLRQLQSLRQELVVAKTQLAALMNLKPGTKYDLAVPRDWQSRIPQLSGQLEALEEQALLRRPELHEEAYQSRISAKETRKALLEMLPGLQLDYSWNYDSNDYLYNNDWRQAGARLSWNLMNIFSGPKRQAVAEAMVEVADARRMALNMAVLTQVHVAYQRFVEARRTYQVTDELSGVEERILGQLQAQAQTRRGGELEAIRGELNAVIAQLRRDMAFAEVQNAAGRLLVTTGGDPLPETVSAGDVEALAQAIKEKTDPWVGL